MLCVYFCDWVTSLRLIFSSSTHFPANFLKSLFYTSVLHHCVNDHLHNEHFLYLFLCRGTSGFFPALDMINKSAINFVEHVSLLYVEAPFQYMPGSDIALSSGSMISDFQSNHQVYYENSCTSLQSHQQWKSVFSPHPPQHLLSTDFNILAILTVERWNLMDILICISLMTKHIEKI